MREECFVTEETAGDRIDKFLAEQYEDLSRSFLQKLLKSGEVMVNGRPVKASYKAAEGDTISFEVPEAVSRRSFRRISRSISYMRITM